MRESKEQMKQLRSYLGISDRPDEQYHKADGSCEWIDAREDFQVWRDSATNLFAEESDEFTTDHHNISLFWVHANPGTGKTYLASHVIAQLQELRLECASHYFHAGAKAPESLGGFLRWTAYQMASSNAAVRKSLTTLCQDGSTFDKDDARMVWNRVFKSGIFQVRYYCRRSGDLQADYTARLVFKLPSIG
jgi:hypothetical protein